MLVERSEKKSSLRPTPPFGDVADLRELWGNYAIVCAIVAEADSNKWI